MGFESADQLAERLGNFVAHASAVWTAYQANGPGRVDRSLFDSVESAYQALDELSGDGRFMESVIESLGLDKNEWPERLLQATRQAHDLARRCVCRPEGLSFITGEAGLMPRRDQHAAFEQAIGLLREQCRQLQRDSGSHATGDDKPRTEGDQNQELW